MLTAVVVVALTAYTYYAVRQGHDFSFLGPMLFAAVIILVLWGFIQVRGWVGLDSNTVVLQGVSHQLTEN